MNFMGTPENYLSPQKPKLFQIVASSTTMVVVTANQASQLHCADACEVQRWRKAGN
jgi:hypothetical protein